MGAPYRWGAKGLQPTGSPRLFDCSGLVTWCLLEVGGPDWRATHNTDRLWDVCAPIATEAELLPGDLVLYGRVGTKAGDGRVVTRDDPDHVMVYMGAGVVVGASGGGSKTLTLADAQAAGARVKTYPRVAYRKDVLGFRRLPFTS
ncbi:peptidoglycan endopeptidase [Corallococcus exiguus]|nr:peptidoglycan endopeptidase [Corallococcus exiguus]